MEDSYNLRVADYNKELEKFLKVSASKAMLYQKIVDGPFQNPLMATYLELGIIVLLLVSKDGNTIHRIALSNTQQAKDAVKTSQKPFNEINIPVNHLKNQIAMSISNNQRYQTDDWKTLFAPALNSKSARFNQATAGIACSIIEPITVLPKGGALIFSFFKHPSNEQRINNFIDNYKNIVENALHSQP
jgi:hypothetical protein